MPRSHVGHLKPITGRHAVRRRTLAVLSATVLFLSQLATPAAAAAESINIIYVIDASRAAGLDGDLQSDACGDPNSDGTAASVLDCEITTLSAMHSTLSADHGDVSIISFASSASISDVDPVLNGIQATARPGADEDANGTPDVTDALNAVTFVDAPADFDAALSAVQALLVSGEQNFVYFLSPGAASGSAGPATGPGSPLQALIDAGVNVWTYAMASGACGVGEPLATIATARCVEVSDPLAARIVPPASWTMQATSSKSSVSFSANAVTIRGRMLDASGAPQTREAMELYRRAFGAQGFTSTGVVRMTDADGRVAVVQSPVKRTEYQWRSPLTAVGSGIPPSGSVAVSVRRLITANVHDRTIQRPTPAVISGLTTPVAPGATVTLRRVGSTTALASSTVRSDGTYSLVKTMPASTWTLYVTVAPHNGMAKGTSSQTSVAVR